MSSRLPDFYIIGATKSGTTALYAYLKQHPQVYLPEVKSPSFYTRDDRYSLGVDWYLQEYFSANSGGLIQGEASTSYLRSYRKVIPRIRRTHGGKSPKFLIALRDPVERAYSHYLHKRRVQIETQTLESALALEHQRLQADPDDWVGYYSEGLYAEQIRPWFTEFGRQNFFIVMNDELKNDPRGVLAGICQFLGIRSAGHLSAPLIANQNARPISARFMRMTSADTRLKRIARLVVRGVSTRQKILALLVRANLKPAMKQSMNPDTRATLREKYRASVDELEALIGKDLSAWK